MKKSGSTKYDNKNTQKISKNKCHIVSDLFLEEREEREEREEKEREEREKRERIK